MLILTQIFINLDILLHVDMTTTKINHHSLLIIILVLSTLLSSSTSKILQLTDSQLSPHINNSPRTLIYFQPSLKVCKQCIATDLEYKKLETNEILNNTGVIVAKIDVGEYEDIGKRYGVTNVPVIMLFDQTFAVKYRGENGAKNFVDWVVEYFGSRVVDLDLTNVRDVKKPYIVVQGAQQQHILNKALYNVDGITAYRTDQLEHNGIAIIHKNDTHNYLGELERIALNQWIEQNIKNTIIPLKNNKANQQILFNENKPALVIFLSKEDKLNHEKYEIFLQICGEFVDKINCGEILPKYQSYVGFHGFFKITDNKKTLIGFVKQKMNIAYRLDMPISDANRESLINFINGALADQIQRIVDNVAPTTAKFNHLKQPTMEQLQKIALENKYVFINFYDPTDQASLFFSKRYDSFANIVKSEEQLKFVEVLAVDCVKYQEYCAEKKFGYYPYLVLLVHGVTVSYEKTEKLPEVPDLVRFLHDKISKKIIPLKQDQNTNQIKLPYVMISCHKIPKQLESLPALSPLAFYHKKSESTKPEITLYTADQQKISKFNKDPEKIIAWLKQQTQQLLSNLLTENPDQKVINAVKNKQPILIILDAESNREIGKKYKIKFGMICKTLKVCGGFADGRNPSYRSLLGWTGLQHEERTRIVYVDVATDVKYEYKGDLEELTAESFKKFMDDVKAGKINSIGTEQKNTEEDSPEVQEL